MSQVGYFKFLKVFPELIDIDDSNDVKLVLLKKLRSMTLKDNTTKLFPVKHGWNHVMFEKLKENGFKNGFKVVYKNKIILHVLVIDEDNDWRKRFVGNIVYPYVDTWKPYHSKYNDSFMSVEEIKNIKRTLLIDNMLK